MFEKLNSLFVFQPKNWLLPASGELSKSEPEETKKCRNCLRRIELDWIRCPYCKSGDFQYNNS